MYLIIYDITENTKRNKVAKLLISEGYERLQLSVFCGIFNPYKNKVWAIIKKELSTNKANSVICIKVTTENFYNLKNIGTFNVDLELITGKKKTVII